MIDYSNNYGISQDYLSRLAQIESSGNPNAYHPASKASGLFQFIPSTAKAYGLSNPFDVSSAVDAVSRFTRDNFNALKQGLGRDPTQGELYLAHQQGATGALGLLSGGNRPAADVVGPKAVTLNGGNIGMSSDAFASQWTDKFEGTGSSGITSNDIWNMITSINPLDLLGFATGVNAGPAGVPGFSGAPVTGTAGPIPFTFGLGAAFDYVGNQIKSYVSNAGLTIAFLLIGLLLLYFGLKKL